MDLGQWIVAEHASVCTRFDRSIAGVVPRDRWRDPAGDGGSSIAHLLFHTAYHEDLAVNAVGRGGPALLVDWRERLGAGGFSAAAGLSEAEDAALSAALDLDVLVDYVAAVHGSTAGWLATLDAADLDRVPESGAALERAGLAADVPWLHSMWAGQPLWFFVQWEAIGHPLNHLGEMVSVRNRLGFSPF